MLRLPAVRYGLMRPSPSQEMGWSGWSPHLRTWIVAPGNRLSIGVFLIGYTMSTPYTMYTPKLPKKMGTPWYIIGILPLFFTDPEYLISCSSLNSRDMLWRCWTSWNEKISKAGNGMCQNIGCPIVWCLIIIFPNKHDHFEVPSACR